MTLRYAHLSPNHKKRAVDVLGESLGYQDTSKNMDMVPKWSPAQEIPMEAIR